VGLVAAVLIGYLRRLEHLSLRQLKLPPQPFGVTPFTVMIPTGKGGSEAKPFLALYPPRGLQDPPSAVMSLEYGARLFHHLAPGSPVAVHGKLTHHAVLTVVNPNDGDVAAGRASIGERATDLLSRAVMR
jgi:hypothetical protein